MKKEEWSMIEQTYGRDVARQFWGLHFLSYETVVGAIEAAGNPRDGGLPETPPVRRVIDTRKSGKVVPVKLNELPRVGGLTRSSLKEGLGNRQGKVEPKPGSDGKKE